MLSSINMKGIKFIFDTTWGSLYIIPTLSIDYDRDLNGYWAIELRWLRWICGISFGHK